MKLLRLCLVPFLVMLPALALWGAADDRQPVLVLLYSRFNDHVTIALEEQRVFRLINLVEKLRKEHPNYRVNVSCEFSGAVADKMAETPTGMGYLKQLQDLEKTGAITLGYVGEPQPPYRDQPKPALKDGMTAEQRWLEQVNAADRALTSYRDFLTGQTDPARPGGLRVMRERLGDPAILGVFTPQLGGEAPYFHLLRRMNLQAIVPGLPDPYFTLNIHGYRAAATNMAANGMVPVPEASAELFWDTGFLRASFTDSADIRGLSADEGKEAFQKLLGALDRSRVRLLQVEVAGYSRYLAKWPDGTPKLLPLSWAYEHPDDPSIPSGIRAYAAFEDVEKAYVTEDATLSWLLGEFLPANQRSRIVSPRDLIAMARTPVGSDLTAETLAAAVRDLLARTSKETNMVASWVRAGEAYYSAADLFQLLATSLAGTSKTWQRPDKVRLTHIYGPIRVEAADETFPSTVVPAGEVARVAALLAPRLNDQTWKPVPSNAVPVRVEIAGKRLIPAQFLALMAEAYLAPSPDTPIKLRYFQPQTAPGYLFPRQNTLPDSGHVWTMRPAPLKLN